VVTFPKRLASLVTQDYHFVCHSLSKGDKFEGVFLSVDVQLFFFCFCFGKATQSINIYIFILIDYKMQHLKNLAFSPSFWVI